MLLVRFLRFLTGYVIFGGSGGFPERFFNLCSANGITVWDAKVTNGCLTAKTDIRGYKRIRLCARRSGMRIRIKEKRGMPFLLKPYKKRKGLLAGIAASAVLLVFLNSAVWTVSVDGNEKYTDGQILKIAEDYGIYAGARKKDIDIKQIREDIKTSVPGLSWFSVNMDGCHISLEVSELKGENEIYDRTTPCNIVSQDDGEVIKLDAYEGTPEVSPGSAVTKGDLLISGVTEKADGSAEFVHARGEAIVRMNITSSAEIKTSLPVLRITGNEKIHKLIIFSCEIPLGFKKSSLPVREETYHLKYNGLSLPAGMKIQYYRKEASEKISLSQSEASVLCGYTLFANEKQLMENSETLEKTVTVSASEDGVKAQIGYINHKKTGIEQFFEVENSEIS